MNTLAAEMVHPSTHPVDVRVQPVTGPRDRMTVAFRVVLAIPHLILVGAPIAFTLSWTWGPENGPRLEWGGAGVLGAVAGVCALIGWFAIIRGSDRPERTSWSRPAASVSAPPHNGVPATSRASESRRSHVSRVAASISPLTEKVTRAQVPRPFITRPTSCWSGSAWQPATFHS
jgi:hypothetical protein